MSDAPLRWGGLRWWWHRRVRTNTPPLAYVVFAMSALLMRERGHVAGYEDHIAWWPYPHVKKQPRPDAAYVAVELERMSTIRIDL